MASNAIVAPVSTSALVRSSMKVSLWNRRHIWRRSRAGCRPAPAADDVDEADIVLDADLVEHLPEVPRGCGVHQRPGFSRRMVSVMPSAVSGLTNHDAPSAAVVGGQLHDVPYLHGAILRVHRPPIIETVLPISALAASEDPVLITTPAPSLPTRSD